MPIVRPTSKVNVPDAGVTTALSSTLYVERYLITLTQTGTMSGNTSITDDAVSPTDAIYVLEFPGGVTLGAFSFTVFGKSFTAAQALNPCLVVARWTGSAFLTQIYTDWSANNTVLRAHMNNNSVGATEIIDGEVGLSKWEDVTRGAVIVGDATARPAEVLVGSAGAGAQLIGDGTDVDVQVPSGDWTMNGLGVSTIANNAITTAKIFNAAVTWAKLQALARGSILRGSSANIVEALSLSGAGAGAFINTDGTDVLARLITGDLSISGASAATISAGLNTYVVKLLIPTASVLTGNSVPVALVGAPGAGKYIKPIACAELLTYNSTTYAVNGVSQLRHATATDACMLLGSSFLFGTNTKTAMMAVNPINAVTDTQIISNQALLWEVGTGDPTVGNSSVTVYLLYEIVTV